MTLVTELGDKTFFIGALMAMKHSGARREVFMGAYGALVAMTLLSSGIGYILPGLVSAKFTHWVAVLLFLYFGTSQLLQAGRLLRSGEGAGPSDELEEVAAELGGAQKNRWGSSVMLQAFVCTFCAEWGDKSQLGTIALAAANDPLGVTLG